MKICFLITGLGIGGAEKHLLKLVPKLKFDKFIISLTNNNEVGKEIERKGIKVYYLGFNRFNLVSTISKFRKIIKNEKPDVLDSYLIHANIFGRVFGRLFGVKKIINSVRNDYSDLRFLNFLDKITKRMVDLYIPNSKSLVRYIHGKNKIALDKIKIVTNGIDLDEINEKLNKNYDIRKELHLKKNSFVLVFVGRLHKQKNIPTLIKAVKLIDDSLVLVIVGKGPERGNLTKLVEKLNLSKRVFLVGGKNNVLNIVNSSNVFVLPSLKEGMSNALLEAMALKKLCVVSNIPQNKELIKDGVNGFTFESRNEKDLAEKIRKSTKIRIPNVFGTKAFKVVKENYQINNVARAYAKIIEEEYM